MTYHTKIYLQISLSTTYVGQSKNQLKLYCCYISLVKKPCNFAFKVNATFTHIFVLYTFTVQEIRYILTNLQRERWCLTSIYAN